MNFDFNTLINNIRSVARALSVERILKVCIILFISGFLFAFYERRTQILHAVMQPLMIKNTKPIDNSVGISQEHILLLDHILRNSTSVNSIAVISVKIRENVKQIIHTNVDKNLQEFFAKIPVTAPLFTESTEMNNRTVFLMSGNIICMDSTANDIGTIAPGFEKLIPYSCAVPIPPTYGDFSGWIFIGFENKPSDWELQQFKIEISKISDNIKKGA